MPQPATPTERIEHARPRWDFCRDEKFDAQVQQRSTTDGRSTASMRSTNPCPGRVPERGCRMDHLYYVRRETNNRYATTTTAPTMMMSTAATITMTTTTKQWNKNRWTNTRTHTATSAQEHLHVLTEESHTHTRTRTHALHLHHSHHCRSVVAVGADSSKPSIQVVTGWHPSCCPAINSPSSQPAMQAACCSLQCIFPTTSSGESVHKQTNVKTTDSTTVRMRVCVCVYSIGLTSATCRRCCTGRAVCQSS